MKVATIKLIIFIISSIILVISILLCREIIVGSISNQNYKNDYAELNNIKYGLFSVDEWKRQIAVILAEEINKMDLSDTNQRALQKHIETVDDFTYRRSRQESQGRALRIREGPD